MSVGGDGCDPLRAMWWSDDGLNYIDQRFLPGARVEARATTGESILAAVEAGAVAEPACVDLFCGFGVALALQVGATQTAAALERRALGHWAIAHLEAIQDARQKFDRRAD